MEVIGSIYTEVSDNFQKGIIRGVFPDVSKRKNTIWELF